MKQFILSVLLVMSAFVSSAHNYYFAFSELKYNDFTQQFEASVELSLHDIEQELMTKGIINHALSTYAADSTQRNIIAAEIAKNFSLVVNGETCTLHSEGMEIQLNGLVVFYFTSEKIKEQLTTLSVQFDALMDSFKEQQNKLTFMYRNKKQSYLFLPNAKIQEIKLSAL